MIRVLFVCTGNICRSPTAEGVFRHLTAAAGLQDSFSIDSAGTTASHSGEAPDDRAIRVAATQGVDLRSLAARQVTPADFSDFDYIYAMDGGHLHRLQSLRPENTRARLAMFIDGQDVPDPWYGGMKDFEHVYDIVLKGSSALLETLRKEHGL